MPILPSGVNPTGMYPSGVNPDGDSAPTLVAAIIAAMLADYATSAIVGTAVYDSKIPQEVDRPAIAVQRISDAKGHVLKGADGTSKARIQFRFTSTLKADCSALQLATFNLFDGFQGSLSGSVQVMAAIHENDVDMTDANVDGSDDSILQILSDYMFRYRVSLPQR